MVIGHELVATGGELAESLPVAVGCTKQEIFVNSGNSSVLQEVFGLIRISRCLVFPPPRGCFDPNTWMRRRCCLFGGKERLFYASATSFKLNPFFSPSLLLLHPASDSRNNDFDSSYFALVFFRKYQKGALRFF